MGAHPSDTGGAGRVRVVTDEGEDPAVRGVGPGTVLGGRYTVRRRLEQLHDTERWSADDTTLGRTVSVLCIAGEDHRTAALLDAARRAASVTHRVFVRILDVGNDVEVSYLVEEDLGEANTLAELVADGGVPGDEVRRITGEVAAALESAGHRGMHHLDLSPDDVLRTPDGDVRLRGLETAAVRAGQEGAEADAARRDAVGVVALAYCGLTGLWPLRAGGSGLAAAPRVPGGVAAPSEIAAGVPRDLDAICRLTLNDDQGPTSPGDFARQVAPWPSRQVVGRPMAGVAPGPLDDAGDTARADTAKSPGPLHAPETPDTLDTLEQPVVSAAPMDAVPATGASRRIAPVVPNRQADDATRVSPRDRQTPDWLRATPTAVTASADPLARRDLDDDGGAPLVGDPDRAQPPGYAGAAGAGSVVVGALGSVGERVGQLARRAVDKVSELSPDTAPRADQDHLGEPAPLVPAEPLTKDESKLALGIVVGFVVLAMVVGIYGVSRIGSHSSTLGGGPGSASRTTTAATSSTAPSGSPSVSPSGTAGTFEPLAILKVTAYDPEGDGTENDNLTPKVYDGDKSTGWYSENYRTDSFGGLKRGVGVVVDLGPNKKPQTVELTIPHPNDVEVFVGPDARLQGATKIGEKAAADGTVTFDVPAKVSGQYIVVWFTTLSADENGKRRAWLNEVVVTG